MTKERVCCDRVMFAVEIPSLYDGVLFYQCGCGRMVHRFPVGTYLRTKADRYADIHGYQMEEP